MSSETAVKEPNLKGVKNLISLFLNQKLIITNMLFFPLIKLRKTTLLADIPLIYILKF